MRAARFSPLFLPLFFLLLPPPAHASAPSGKTWFTIASPHFRVHHTPPLEHYARAAAQAFERALPEIEKRMNWKAPEAIDVVVMDPSDSANGLAMNFPNTHIELFAVPFASDSPLAYYTNWVNELAVHELTHIVANDTTLGTYRTLRSIFGSWVKPNGLQPVWLSEGLAVYQETSLTTGGRGRSPFLEALLRESVVEGKLNDPTYTSLDRFNDTVPWWPSGNTQYLLGYAIQALPTKETPNLPGRVSYANAGHMVFAPNRALREVNGHQWSEIWAQAPGLLGPRYQNNPLPPLPCKLTASGRHTGGHALSSDGWIYFSEEDWNHGYHLARVRADAACGGEKIERLVRKPYSGPSSVAVSPSGAKVAYAVWDPGFETEFSDVYIWNRDGGVERITKDLRARDPAFLGEETLVFVKENGNSTETIVAKSLKNGQERPLFFGRVFQRISGLYSRGGRILFALHDNEGHEKIYQWVVGDGAPLLPRLDPVREFERNPFLAADGSVYFAAAYGFGPQEIYRLRPGATRAELALSSRAGYLDRPVLSEDGKTIFAEEYGLNGVNIARAEVPAAPTPLPVPRPDLHEFLTGEPPVANTGPEVALPPSVPYSATGTTGTSLWPQYWFPEIAFAQEGFLAGASTSGNDALDYHHYFASAQYDNRASFPVYRAYYLNRIYKTHFLFEANQTNNYFLSSNVSNRNASYSAEALFSAWDFSFALGTAYRDRALFGTRVHNLLFYQSIGIDRSGKTPAAISPNWGASFRSFLAEYPSSQYEAAFVDVRPTMELFFRGLHPAHSVSLAAAGGVTSNRLLASNYYQGGGPSPLSESAYVVRGYPTDSLFGQKIATVNLAYTLPLAHPYRGLGTNPVFLTDLGLRFLADAGTANYLAVYSGDNFRFYERGEFGRRKIYGFGLDFLANGSIFYHIPVTTTLGLHYGTEKRYGGGLLGYLGINFGINRGAFRGGAQR